MSGANNRAHVRKKCCIPAFVANMDDSYELKCTIRDVSKVGCKIVSNNANELPEQLLLLPEGFEVPIIAKVRWRSKKMAGLSFPSFDLLYENSDAKQTDQDTFDDEILDLGAEKKILGYSGRMQRFSANK